MTKQDYTMYVYKADQRYKSGERLVSTSVWTDRDERSMAREAKEVQLDGYRVEYFPTMKTVKNLMTGKDVQIPTDTPWCCNPASETYWSM